MQLKVSWITYTHDNLNSPRASATSSNELLIYGLGMDKGRRSNHLLEVQWLQIIKKYMHSLCQYNKIHNYYDLFPIGIMPRLSVMGVADSP